MNELTVSSGTKFVEPHYIEELGCEGLTAEEIATSLNARVNNVRMKLKEDKNQTLKSLKVLCVTLKNINGVEYEEFLLPTAASKFFVARYENDLGDGYLIYLLGIEVSHEKLKEEVALLKTKLLGQKDQTLLLAEHSTLKKELAETKEKVATLTEEAKMIICPATPYFNTLRKEIKKKVTLLYDWGGPKEMERFICNRIAERYKIAVLYHLRVVDYVKCLDFISKFESQGGLGERMDPKMTSMEFYEGPREKPTYF